jgi:glycosyltransferase involved in cell wall biosynthesis
MKVLILSTHKKGGGAFIAASNLNNVLLAMGHESSVLSLDTEKSLLDKIFFLFNFYFDQFLRRFLLKPKNPIFHSTAILNKYSSAFINKLNVDIVLVHWCSNGLISPREISKIKAPYVFCVHDSWFACGFEHHPFRGIYSDNMVDRFLMKNKRQSIDNASGIIFPSRWQEEVFSARYDLSMPTEIIPNVIPFDLFNNEVVLNEKARVFVIGVVGQRMLSNISKGGDTLLSVFKILDKLLENVGYTFVFKIVGKLPRKIPSDIYDYKNIEVIHLGELAHSNIQNFMSKIDVFLNLSKFENLSTTNIEACLCGKPVIAFDVGGNSEMVINQVNGFLCPAFDAQLVSVKLVELASNTQKRVLYGMNSAQIFKDKFAKDIVVAKTINFLNQVI